MERDAAIEHMGAYFQLECRTQNTHVLLTRFQIILYLKLKVGSGMMEKDIGREWCKMDGNMSVVCTTRVRQWRAERHRQSPALIASALQLLF